METEFFKFKEVIPGTPAYELYLEFRYEIFCNELHRIAAESCALSCNGHPIETDQYDVYSRHFMAYHKNSDSPAASVRVITPNPLGLNVAARYAIDQPLPYADATNANVGEISRMAIASQFRRRQEDKGKPFQGDPETEMSLQPDARRRHQPDLVLGMYREIYLLCNQIGIDYCMAAMENRFSRLLRTLGFPWLAISPINENVEPPRRVYIIGALDIERSLSQRETQILDFLKTKQS
ncbi:MAG: GNAT family N-acetyltransferase [Methylophilaceae bacterium]|nr:GNAT family N-acetyltransferase [Methylophilaceae bacterium]